MVDFKIVINDVKTGKSYQKELKDPDSQSVIGKKIGNILQGELLNMAGYEFEITGGSDNSGFPMRKDVEGTAKRKILAVKGVGLKPKTSKTKKSKLSFKGIKLRKTVAGNTISQNTSQINLKITKFGKDPLDKPTENAKEKTE